MKNRSAYPVLDVAKLVASFFVVAIHVKLFDELSIPGLDLSVAWFVVLIGRLAVPFFFFSSSFFFFRKVCSLPKTASAFPCFLHFAKRLFRLWFFWFVVGLPMYVFVSRKSGHGSLTWLLRDIVFANGGVFYGWFLLSLFYGISAFMVSRRAFGQKWTKSFFAVGGVLVVLPAYSLASWNWFSRLAAIFGSQWDLWLGAALLPLAIGAWFAENESELRAIGRRYRIFWVLGFAFSLGCMVVEALFQKRTIGPAFPNGFYPKGLLLSLCPALVSMLAVLFSFDCPDSPWIRCCRSLSIVVYLFHGAVLHFLRLSLGRFYGGVSSPALFFFTIAGCLLCGWFLLSISGKHRFEWIKQVI